MLAAESEHECDGFGDGHDCLAVVAVAELEAAMTELAAFVDGHMPRLASYGFYLDAARSRMTVVAVHPDSASREFHLDVGAAALRRFAPLIDLLRTDVYGRVTNGALERLQRKARTLGDATVSVHARHAGFAR